MNITDVPESGIYLQYGAITQLVVQINDVNTDEPIQLQTATGLTISLLYPDGSTYQTFEAALYTDGSDGRIAYTTANDGASNIDLSQIGLYKIQGWATIGDVQIPKSSESDFYVLSNTDTGAEPPIAYTSSALIFFDAASVRWAMTVTTAGAVIFTARPAGPINSLTLNKVVMKDSDGVYWNVVKNTGAGYTATPDGDPDNAVEYFILPDSNNVSWVVTISPQGVLGAA